MIVKKQSGKPPLSDSALASLLKVLCDGAGTDDGNALRLTTYLAGRMRYVPQQKQWFQFDGKRWVPDGDGEVVREFRRMSRLLLKAARKMEDEKRKEELIKLANSLGNKARIFAAIDLAKSVEDVPLAFSVFDQNPGS